MYIEKTERDLDKWPDAEYKRFKNKMYWYAVRNDNLVMRIVSTSYAYEITATSDLEAYFLRKHPDIVRLAVENGSSTIAVTQTSVCFGVLSGNIAAMGLKIKIWGGQFITSINGRQYTVEKRNGAFFLEASW